MAESNLLLWLFVIPALTAVVEYVIDKAQPRNAGRIAITGTIITFCIAVSIAGKVLSGMRLIALNGQFYADGLSALVAVVVTLVCLASTIYAYPYLHHEVAQGKVPQVRLPLYFVLDMIFISTMTCAAVTNNVIMLYVVVEATTLASALLVTFYWKSESLEAGYKYLLLCSVGITVGLLGCVILYSAAVPFLDGTKAMLITEIAKVAGQFPPTVILVGTGLIIIGFGVKAGFIPFHAWLPDAHSQSPSPVSALLSGVTIKVAVYAIARVAIIAFPGHTAISIFCILIGLVTMLIGIVVAFSQTDLKRMLAYSSISQMGYIILGFGIGSYLGFFGAIYHIFNHAVAKSMLFLCTGVMLYQHGTTLINELSQKKHHPLMAVCFFIGVFAIGGVPPLNGFWSKFAIFMAAAQAHLWWALAIALFTSLLTLACLVRAGYQIFLKQEFESTSSHWTPVTADSTALLAATREQAAVLEPERGECHLSLVMSGIIVIMTVLVIASGLNLDILNRLLDVSANALLNQMAGG